MNARSKGIVAAAVAVVAAALLGVVLRSASPSPEEPLPAPVTPAPGTGASQQRVTRTSDASEEQLDALTLKIQEIHRARLPIRREGESELALGIRKYIWLCQYAAQHHRTAVEVREALAKGTVTRDRLDAHRGFLTEEEFFREDLFYRWCARD